MRVTESIPIYRARLTGQAGAIGFSDLLRGVKVQIRPRARPSAAELAAVNAAPLIRPMARPGE
jgi:soluble lytic murein transglycosylase